MRFCGGTVSFHEETCPAISQLLDIGCRCNSTVGLLVQSLPLLQALRVHSGAGSACQEKQWCAANIADVQTGFAGDAGGSKRKLV